MGMGTLISKYDARIAAGELSNDPAQRLAAEKFDELAEKLRTGSRRRWFSGRGEPAPGGIYLWGGVGRGKSMLMDMFVSVLDNPRKRRVHFHEFMQEIHSAMNEARTTGVSDALAPVADKLIDELRLLALDEMQITDIADAMIVGRLFSRLREGGVTVVTTSNRPPVDLYKDGLNRKLFEPFIDLINDELDVIELVAQADYRQSRLEGEQVYFTPADAHASAAIDTIWSALTGDENTPFELTVKGRTLRLDQFHNAAARIDFGALCERPLGAADFLALADTVRVLVLEDIPILSPANFDAAKRFVTLIDALYEAKVRLIASAAAAPEDLYQSGAGSFEFERTASRLREMQSEGWGAV